VTLAKVNHKIHPLDKELSNGDIVEVVVDKNKKPNPFWMSFVKTLKAKNNIKLYLKKEDKDIYRERGKDIMNKYLEKA
jgi:GTP pyrophosphokinase